VVSIDVLPDEVLLAIFKFCGARNTKQDTQAWQSLVHVCRRWRSVVFGSPNCLDLGLVCTAKTPVKDMLNIWPALPLYIPRCRSWWSSSGVLDNIIAALECSDRVRTINLVCLPTQHLEKISAAMQVPFPELTDLRLHSYGTVVLPDSFLGGSAARLRHLILFDTPFPNLPKFLLSACHLVSLSIRMVPLSGYFSSEAMVAALSILTRLNILLLGDLSPPSRSRPDRASRRLPPPTRSVLSVLTYFSFEGDGEYLDDLVAHITAPRLNKLHVVFLTQIVSDTPHLTQFICRAPGLRALEKARVTFDGCSAAVDLSSLTPGDGVLRVVIPCRELDRQISFVEQVCALSLPHLSALEDLYICKGRSPWSTAHWKYNIENMLWLELLHPFRTVKNLYLCQEFVLRIVPALPELNRSRATELLPSLQNIFLEVVEPWGPVEEGIRQFVAMRQITSNIIAVSCWDRQDQTLFPDFCLMFF
jgi:hypothetical protein